LTIRAVFFDFGGTLLVMRRDRIFSKVLAEEGYQMDLGTIHSAYGSADPWWLSVYGARVMSPSETSEAYRALEERVFSALFPQADHLEAVRISRQVRKRWPELAHEVPPKLYPDAEPTLQRLKSRGYSLGLVSNAPADTRKTVETIGISKYLDTIAISGVVGYTKPNPEIFRVALKEVRASPAEAVHVGDVYEADVIGARNAGIEGILIDRDGTAERADCPRIGSLAELDKYLR